MKAIFIAELDPPSASSRQRLWALQQCGVEVYTINKSHYRSNLGKVASHLAWLTKQPLLYYNHRLLQKAILELARQVNPGIIWFEWPRELNVSLLKKLKNLGSKPILISFQDDNPWGDRKLDKWMWKEYFKLIPYFDMHLIKRKGDAEFLKRHGAKDCKIWRHGIYSPLFHPSIGSHEKKYPVSFVGTCFDKRKELIGYLLEKNIPIHVFGNRWKQRSNLTNKYPEYFHPAVEGEAYADVLRHSQISLGLVSQSNKDEWTMRSYEVPGCGGLIVAEKTNFHEQIFSDGVDALLFSSPEDCSNKLLKMLQDPVGCQSMGKAAYEKFLSEDWTLEAEMRKFLNSLDSLTGKSELN
ncbi:MAG TPA: glycosyltransferase [Flavisolibacter sp.]|nr:glycosyltransferase [Flavisolibacter sp.]